MINEPMNFPWQRMVRAVERVRERLMRAAAALEQGGVPYALIGGNAVATWVARVDESAVRNTQDVDVLIDRKDFPAAIKAMSGNGFIYRHAAGVEMFLDGANARARDAVYVIFANEKVRPEYPMAAPSVEESECLDSLRVISLSALVRMKLTSYRDKDRTHLRDLLDVGLIDESWCKQLPPELAERLKRLIDSPEG